MIFVAIGANLPSARHPTPLEACEAAVEALRSEDLRLVARSRWYRTEPVPPSGQPWYVNGVAQVETALPPHELLARLHEIEADFGRVRVERNEARVLDLDLLAYDDRLIEDPGGMVLPHPRLHERAFVLLPLAELAPDWRHPRHGRTVREMIDALPPGQRIEPM